MALIILLDANILGLLVGGQPKPGNPDRQTPCRQWFDQRASTPGRRVLIPAIADYEVRREIERKGAAAQRARLNSLQTKAQLIPVTPAARLKAAEFWALVRRGGLPTAPDLSLDGDTILAGVAATVGSPGDTVLVATDNTRHLGRFPCVVSLAWEGIN